jgi:hypothetical protein
MAQTSKATILSLDSCHAANTPLLTRIVGHGEQMSLAHACATGPPFGRSTPKAPTSWRSQPRATTPSAAA